MNADPFRDIQKLESDLWEAADHLRANSKLTSSDYFMPVLGVIFLRHAANRFASAHRQIQADQASGKMPRQKVLPADYIARRSLYLPQKARYDWIMQQAAVSGAGLPRLVTEAMIAIELEFEPLAGVLPKDYGIFETKVLEVADCLDILHARVELAVFESVRGSATESFTREGREVYFGNQVLAGHVLGYDPGKQFRQSDHTLDNIFLALEGVFLVPKATRRAKEQLADYLVLDALIGNTDRHHENWGILRKRTERGWQVMLAPTFDHASSLGRELVDNSAGKCRRRLLAEGRLAQYAEKAPGAIFWQATDKHGISPLELVRRAAGLHPELFAAALKRLEKLDRARLHMIVGRVPENWMSELARDFGVELMCYTLDRLKRITP